MLNQHDKDITTSDELSSRNITIVLIYDSKTDQYLTSIVEGTGLTFKQLKEAGEMQIYKDARYV